MATVIIRCECESSYQDEKYGKNKRVGNTNKSHGATCCVCGRKSGDETPIRKKK